MGRLERGLDSLRLLCTLNLSRAQQLSQDLAQVNQLRHDLSEEMFNHAQSLWLKSQPLTTDEPIGSSVLLKKIKKKLIFVAHSSYHEGIVGLVAGRLAEKFNRPAIVIAQGKTQSKGSGRSIKGFDMIKALRQIENLLLELGGHELAAGFTAETKKLSLIQKKLEKLADRQLKTSQLQPELKIDCLIDFKDITWTLFNELEKLQPFGFANPQPLFATRGVKIASFRPVGQDNRHLKLRLSPGTCNLEPIDAIAFNFGQLSPQLTRNQPLDIVYTIESNHWNHRKSLQLKIKDVSPQHR
jgi:single-stranded-DNA-specific exonuclease